MKKELLPQFKEFFFPLTFQGAFRKNTAWTLFEPQNRNLYFSDPPESLANGMANLPGDPRAARSRVDFHQRDPLAK